MLGFATHFYFIPLLSNSFTGQTAHHTFTLDDSNDGGLKQGWLILVDIAAHLRDKIAHKPQFWGRE